MSFQLEKFSYKNIKPEQLYNDTKKTNVVNTSNTNVKQQSTNNNTEVETVDLSVETSNNTNSDSNPFSFLDREFLKIRDKEITYASSVPHSNDYVNLKKINYSNIFDDGFLPQGMTIVDNNFLISAYCKGKVSRIYVYNIVNPTSKSGLIELNDQAHVGGISYNEENGKLYVTSTNGKVNEFDKKIFAYLPQAPEKNLKYQIMKNV